MQLALQHWLLSALSARYIWTAAAQPLAPNDEPESVSALDTINLPDGFSIEYYTADTVPFARQLALSQGTNKQYPNAHIVYVGSKSGNVYALVDRDGSSSNVTVHVLLSNLLVPQGVAWRNYRLYVAEPGRIIVYENADDYALAGQAFPGGTVTTGSTGEPAGGTVISSVFPADQPQHADHFIAFGPDDKLYVPQGSELNTGPCAPVNENLTACTINRMNLDGSGLEEYARGFDWDPDTGGLWAAVNGRDNFNPGKDNRPDDTLVFLPEPGLDYGFPYCHRQGYGDPYQRDAGPGTPIADDVNMPPGMAPGYCDSPGDAYPPSQTLGPHVAALGMTFYTGKMFPESYQRSIFIAERGSWNRDEPIGYRVVNVGVDRNGTAFRHDIFADGWLQNSTGVYIGRPVDVLVLHDGSLLVSDDFGDAVYRITYTA